MLHGLSPPGARPVFLIQLYQGKIHLLCSPPAERYESTAVRAQSCKSAPRPIVERCHRSERKPIALSGRPFPSGSPCGCDPAPGCTSCKRELHTPGLWRPARVPWREASQAVSAVSCVGASSVSTARAAPGRGRPHPVNRWRGGHFGSCCVSEQECATSTSYKSRGHMFSCLSGAQTSGNRTAGSPGDPSRLPGSARHGGCLREAPAAPPEGSDLPSILPWLSVLPPAPR